MNSVNYSKAFWLVQNTTLTFGQIAEYCQLHPLEVKAIADGVSKMSTTGYDLLEMGEVSQEEIDRCQNDPEATLQPIEKPAEKASPKKRKPRAKKTT